VGYAAKIYSIRHVYRGLLREYGEQYGCLVVAYCLMTNHVHHLLVPLRHDSLRWTLQMTHKRYAEYFNAINGWSGHAWQEKFYSSPVDERFLWITVRYIERNPVATHMVQEAQHYQWSSAAFHCGLREDDLITADPAWVDKKARQKDWKTWLASQDPKENLERLRKNTLRDLPTGSEEFLDMVEAVTGHPARPAPMGRPKKKIA
jgi:putative transposase